MAISRRAFLKTTSLAAAGATLPYCFSSAKTMADETKAPSDRPLVGCIGNGGMGTGDANAIKKYGEIVALCDVDRSHSDTLKDKLKIGDKAGFQIYADYRKLLDRQDIELVTISTPDHWHTKIAIDALHGKDVYCQKPLTLTINEGKLLRRVVKETGRVLQVGTQQRSQEKLFQLAVAIVQEGRIGKVRRVTCAIGGSPRGGPFAKAAPPASLNWEMWQGQTPLVDYIPERCHKEFRWWYEYSGGKLTDWGAHHVDIAQWAIGMDHFGPTSIEVISVDHPVPLSHGLPTADNAYNTAATFAVRATFPGGVEMMIRDKADDLGFDNGIMFEGENGKFFVNRGKLTGKPVDDLATNPIPAAKMTALRKGQPVDSHMGNFIRAARDRSTPISDVDSHHRALTTCHLANIAMRLGRTLKWDAASEQIVGDPEANAWQRREQRKGYETA